MESERIWPDAIIVREMSRLPSNFRMDLSLEEYLEKFGIPGIEGIDTRCLVQILREKGTMNGFLTTSEHFDKEEVISRLHQYTTGRVVEKVTCSEIGYYPGNAFVRDSSGRPMRRVSVALLDLGAKYSIIRNLTRRGCDVTVYPALTPAEKFWRCLRMASCFPTAREIPRNVLPSSNRSNYYLTAASLFSPSVSGIS